ncbi:hypothetical protein BH09PLA1_BH09PLA1_08930 [soil metagenome]
MKRQARPLLSIGFLLATSQFASARLAEPSQQELVEQIRALQTKVQELETKQQAAKLSAQQVDATVQRVMEDANRRSQLLAEMPMSSSWNNGKLLFQSDDGNFVLHPSFQFQFRSVTAARYTSSDYNVEDGFELRRMKLGVDGNVFSPKTTFNFLWATNRKDGSVQLEEAWVRQALTAEWSILGGQFKTPFAHESIVSSKRVLAAERTLGTVFFTGGDNFVQGVSGIYSRDTWRAQAAFHDGARNNFNQGFRDFPTNNADWGAGGRVEFKIAGDWKAYDDFSALSAKKELLVIGGGVDYTEAGNTAFLLETIDAQYKNPNGLAVYGAFIGRFTRNGPVSPATPTAPENDLFDWSLVVQGSYLLKNNWEPFLRYDLLRFDEDGLATGSENIVHTITVGANYYFHGHDSKLTFDLLYLPNGSPIAEDGAGILVSDGDAEIIFRAQYQLLL